MYLFEKIKCCLPILGLWGIILAQSPAQQKTIKHYHVIINNNKQIKELTGLAHISYLDNGAILDSTNYSFIVPLSEKYAYVDGPDEGLRLLRKMDKEIIDRFEYKYNLNGLLDNIICKGSLNQIIWKEFYKYTPDNVLIKTIRFNPSKAESRKNLLRLKKQENKSSWSEAFVYDSTGTMMEHQEFYDEYLIERTTYRLLDNEERTLLQEYFDPSLIQKTVYKFNELGKIKHQLVIKGMGVSVKSITYSYDGFGRKNKTITFNEDGLVQDSIKWSYKQNQSISMHYNEMGYIHRQFVKDFDSRLKIEKERRLDGIGNLLFKQVYSYSEGGNLYMIRKFNPLHPNRTNEKIPLNVSIFEYD